MSGKERRAHYRKELCMNCIRGHHIQSHGCVALTIKCRCECREIAKELRWKPNELRTSK